MSKAEFCRALIDYNQAAWRRVFDSAATLAADLVEANADYSHGSIRDQLIHVATVEEGWLRGLEADPNARGHRLAPESVATLSDLRSTWERTAERWRIWAEELDDETAEDTAPGMKGPNWQVVAHVVNHGTDHRAQILRLLHDAGAPSFDQDAIYCFWYGGLPE